MEDGPGAPGEREQHVQSPVVGTCLTAWRSIKEAATYGERRGESVGSRAVQATSVTEDFTFYWRSELRSFWKGLAERKHVVLTFALL